MTDLQNMLSLAIQLTDEQPPGKIFELKELFPGTVWNTMCASEKRHLGSMYSREQINGKIPNIIRKGNNKQFHNIYQKI